MTGVSLTLFGNRGLRPEKLLNGDIYYTVASVTNLLKKAGGVELRKDHLEVVQFRRKVIKRKAPAKARTRASGKS